MSTVCRSTTDPAGPVYPAQQSRSSPPRTLSPTQTPPSRLPDIKVLRKTINYGDPKLDRCYTFVKHLRDFRQKYGLVGRNRTNTQHWYSPDYQDALKRMSTVFLDREGYGEVYWPSDPTAVNYNSLHYSTQRTFITQSIRQLIFLEDRMQASCNKSKKKKKQQEMPSASGTKKQMSTPYRNKASRVTNADVRKPSQPFTSSTPAMGSTIGHYSNVNARQQDQTNVAASATDVKDSIHFYHQVIFSRKPIYQAKSWHPEGHFLGKSLSELVDELPFEKKEGLTGLIIQLKCPGFDIEETIECGKDAIYDICREELKGVVNLCFQNHLKGGNSGELVVRFYIEAVREGTDEDHEDHEESEIVLWF